MFMALVLLFCTMLVGVNANVYANAQNDSCWSNLLDYTAQELIFRFGSVEEVIRQLDLNRPIRPESLQMQIELPLISEVINLELIYMYDENGVTVTKLSEDSMSLFIDELLRRSEIGITPEQEYFDKKIATEATLLFTLMHYENYGYIPISPQFMYFNLRRIAYMLDNHDGLTMSQSHTVTSIGNNAANIANWFPRPNGIDQRYDNAAWRDAFRHFAWGRYLAMATSPHISRIATNNHEWAGVINNILGSGNFQATQVVNLRREIAREVVMGQGMFNHHFDNDTVMDFWNNRAGVNSASVIPHGDHLEVFMLYWNRGDLIRSIYFGAVSPARRSEMFHSRWFLHF